MFHFAFTNIRPAGIALVCCALMVNSASADIIHVKADATGANDGTSWQDAYVHLQDALTNAQAGDEIWVATGVYKPDQGQNQTPGDRDASFELFADLALFGGFAGDEETLEDRAGLFDETILSGDLDGDDQPDFVNYEENSYHVVLVDAEGGEPCILDGFRMIGGNADDSGSSTGLDGAGALLLRGQATLQNCSLIRNQAARGGGAFIGDWDNGATVVAHSVFA